MPLGAADPVAALLVPSQDLLDGGQWQASSCSWTGACRAWAWGCPGSQPPRVLPPAGRAHPDTVCHATISFLHFTLGLLVPLALSIYWWPPPAASEAAIEPGCSPLRRLARSAQAVAHRQLRQAAGVSAGPLVRVLVCYFMLAYVWILSKVWAGLL